MSELKTLKDLIISREFVDSRHAWINLDELKAEAVKWVKQLREEREEWGFCTHHISWIIHFFNITEEDLK